MYIHACNFILTATHEELGFKAHLNSWIGSVPKSARKTQRTRPHDSINQHCHHHPLKNTALGSALIDRVYIRLRYNPWSLSHLSKVAKVPVALQSSITFVPMTGMQNGSHRRVFAFSLDWLRQRPVGVVESHLHLTEKANTALGWRVPGAGSHYMQSSPWTSFACLLHQPFPALFQHRAWSGLLISGCCWNFCSPSEWFTGT